MQKGSGIVKIAEVEGSILAEGLTEERFGQFQNCLKRVSGNYNKCQHCYITAAQMPERYADDAVRLLLYGLEHFAQDWVDYYRSYETLARVCIGRGRFKEAREVYWAELMKLMEFSQQQYTPELLLNLMFTEMHVSCFTYTDDLRAYHQMLVGDTSFGALSRRGVFYGALAELIISLHDKNRSGACSAYCRALEALNLPVEHPLTAMLTRHRYPDDAHATAEAVAYLEGLRI